MIDRKLDRDWQVDNIPYPDPVTEVIDDSFSKYVIFNTSMERLFTGCRWAEGPAVSPSRNDDLHYDRRLQLARNPAGRGDDRAR